MRRRTLLRSLGGLTGATAIAGCLGGPGGSTGSPTPSPTPTPTESGPGTPTGTSFEVQDRSCGSGDNAATVSFDDGSIAVDGVIGGRDACDTAEADVTMEADVLVLTVEVVEEPGTEEAACAQCLTDIEYSFTATFSTEGPAQVRVVHRSADGTSTVATGDRP